MSDFETGDPWTDESVFDPDAEDVEETPPTAEQSLRYFGADFDVEGLVRRLRSGELTIPSFDPESEAEAIGYEGFQRHFVWPKKQMDRFIESLLLGYPVPGIFLVEMPNRKYLVLDGQQRLRTLRAFYDGKIGDPPQDKIYRLEHVASGFANATYDTLSPADRRLLDNTFIQATIVVPKTGPGARESVYRLFERINSSGVKLQPQEIRVALFAGPTINFLRDLNNVSEWRELFGGRHSRLKDHELILRYLALTEAAEALKAHGWDRTTARASYEADGVKGTDSPLYFEPMSTFLNAYLERHAAGKGLNFTEITQEFKATVAVLAEAEGRDSLRLGGRQINAAHTDAIMAGITLALREGAELRSDSTRKALASLVKNPKYLEAVSGSTSHMESVVTRLSLAYEAFAD